MNTPDQHRQRTDAELKAEAIRLYYEPLTKLYHFICSSISSAIKALFDNDDRGPPFAI